MLYQQPSPAPLVEQQLPPPQYHPSAPHPPSTNHNSSPRPLDVINLVPAPSELTASTSDPPDSLKLLPCSRHSSKVKSRLDSPGTSDFEDLSPSLVLTKGPPDKLDASPRKLRFLATFGLTTLTTRNELELNKLSRCKSLPDVVVEEREDGAPTTPTSPPPLSLPQPRQSPRSLPHSHAKLTFMTSLDLFPLSHNQRKEREVIWQEVLAERRRRQCVTPLVQYCSESRVNSPDYCPVRWPGIEGVIQSYQQYHAECSLEVAVLREESARLQAELSDRRKEVSALECRIGELQVMQDQLQGERDETNRSLDTLKGVVKALMALGHSND